jgi:7,8-dihydropterin-6-yl-methyl-4-(beta-D-ribofuranosyl)aminobenzene 5'-phosphate synthase
MNTLMLAVIPFFSMGGATGEEELNAMPRLDGEITVTILFDNFWTDDRLNIGWGFAALLETPEHTILFDTGADGDALLENMRLLGKDPTAVEAIVISHAHHDHTGGLAALFDLGARPPVYLLGAFPAGLRDEVANSASVIESAAGQEIVPGIRTTGQVGSEIPEQALILDTAKGIVVITGCAHPGIVQMVERARGLSSKPLHLVMGGFHLMQATGGEIERVLTEFQRLGVERAGPTHCSGLITMNAFQNTYGENFQRLGVGRVLTFPVAS